MTEPQHHESSRAEARAIAAYLTALRTLVNEASVSRTGWIRQLGTLMRDARSAEEKGPISAEAGLIGTQQGAIFRAYLERLQKLEPPTKCQDCHLIVSGWLEKQIAACDVMVDVGRSGELASLRSTQGLLAQGRDDTRRFASEYAGLVAWLRERMASAPAKKSTHQSRGRFGWMRKG